MRRSIAERKTAPGLDARSRVAGAVADLSADDQRLLIVLDGFFHWVTDILGINATYPAPSEASGYDWGDGAVSTAVALGDLNGDELQDLLVANPNKAEVVLFLQEPGHFHPPQTFPSFSEISSISYGHFFRVIKIQSFF